VRGFIRGEMIEIRCNVICLGRVVLVDGGRIWIVIPM
jgi:hypothetical protein